VTGKSSRFPGRCNPGFWAAALFLTRRDAVSSVNRNVGVVLGRTHPELRAGSASPVVLLLPLQDLAGFEAIEWHHMLMKSTFLIQDLNITCPVCKYPIPPWEVSLVAQRTVRCPKCQLAFSPPDANL
jgi:hypothetical protein